MFSRDLLYFYGRLLGTEVGPISDLPGCILKPTLCIPVMIFGSFLAKSQQIVIGESMALSRGTFFEIS